MKAQSKKENPNTKLKDCDNWENRLDSCALASYDSGAILFVKNLKRIVKVKVGTEIENSNVIKNIIRHVENGDPTIFVFNVYQGGGDWKDSVLIIEGEKVIHTNKGKPMVTSSESIPNGILYELPDEVKTQPTEWKIIVTLGYDREI